MSSGQASRSSATAWMVYAMLRATLHQGGFCFLLNFAASLALALVAPTGVSLVVLVSQLLLFGPIQGYLAWRIIFDARLFEGLARASFDSLSELDGSLYALGLIQPRANAAVERSLDDRIQGTMRLQKRYWLCVGAQYSFTLGAVAAYFFQNVA